MLNINFYSLLLRKKIFFSLLMLNKELLHPLVMGFIFIQFFDLTLYLICSTKNMRNSLESYFLLKSLDLSFQF